MFKRFCRVPRFMSPRTRIVDPTYLSLILIHVHRSLIALIHQILNDNGSTVGNLLTCSLTESTAFVLA